MGIQAQTIDVMYEDGNCKQRLQQRDTNRLSMLRKGLLTPDEYRLAQSIAEDMEAYAAGSGGALHTLPDGQGYVALPRAGGLPRAPQERYRHALDRLNGAYRALAGSTYQRKTRQAARADFEHWIRSDPAMRAFERRCRIRNGDGLFYIGWMLDQIGAAQIYDAVRWRVVIRSEAPVAA